MNKDEFYEYEDRAYLNPTLSSGEQEQFITNFRGIQDQNNAQISTQTHNLGTNIPSNLGGLGGGESYFNARYQTPQVDEMITGLKTAAQAQALNDAMKNYQNQLTQRYNDAYRKYQQKNRKRANNILNGYNNPSGNNTNNPAGNNSTWDGEIETNPTDPGTKNNNPSKLENFFNNYFEDAKKLTESLK